MYLFDIAKKAFGFGVIPKIASLINVLLLPLITPFLTPFDYGIWGIVSSYYAIFVSIAPLGLNLFLTNGYYEYRYHWRVLWGKVMAYFYASGIILSVLFTLLIMGILTDVGWKPRLLIALLGSVPILFFGNNTIAQHLYPLKGEPAPLVGRNLLGSIVGISATFVSVYFFRMGYWGFLIGAALTALTSFLLFCPVLYQKEQIKPIWNRKWHRFKELFLISWPLIPHTLGFRLLSSSSRIIMDFYKIPVDDIGLYSNGYMMGDYVTIVTTSLVVALLPQIQEAYRSGNFVRYRKLYYLCQLTTLTMVLLSSIWMPEIYRIFIRNEEFQSCSHIASLICFANALYPFYSFLSSVAFIKKGSKQLLWLVFVPGTVNIILCALFIPLFGYIAAVYTTLISYWTIAVIPFVVRYYKEDTVIWLGRMNKIILLIVILLTTLVLSRVLYGIPSAYKVTFSLILAAFYFHIVNKKSFKDIFVIKD